jgi:hypothetical protein
MVKLRTESLRKYMRNPLSLIAPITGPWVICCANIEKVQHSNKNPKAVFIVLILVFLNFQSYKKDLSLLKIVNLKLSLKNISANMYFYKN